MMLQTQLLESSALAALSAATRRVMSTVCDLWQHRALCNPCIPEVPISLTFRESKPEASVVVKSLT